MIPGIVIRLSRPLINRAIRKGLRNECNRREIRSLIRNGWAGYRQYVTSVPHESTMGARIMLRLAVVSEAFYLVLAEHFGSEKKALKLFNKIAWSIYARMGKVAWRLAGLKTRDGYQRLRKAIMLFRKFPFGPPSYRWKDLPAGPGVVAFNCERCPVAGYFRQKGTASFGYSTWCQYDFQLAELWGGRLELTNTIAGGAEVCDFRWKVNSNAKS